MGGKNSGRWGDRARRQRAAALYASGLSLAQVGARLGCTRQAAHYLLRAAGARAARGVAVHCPRCGSVAGRLPAVSRPRALALCSDCLAHAPDAPFGERLRACRVAAGLSRNALAREAGIPAPALAAYEAAGAAPAGRCLTKLLAAVGPALVPGCEHLRPVPPPPLPGRLRACRRAAGLLQKDVAAGCGLHPVQLNAYERGRYLPSWRTLRRLVALLGPDLLTADG
jgi:transcriptional regulator with XRE-family HTH domain